MGSEVLTRISGDVQLPIDVIGFVVVGCLCRFGAGICDNG